MQLGYLDRNEPNKSQNGFLHLNNSKMLLQTMQPDLVAKHLKLDGSKGSANDLFKENQGSTLTLRDKNQSAAD